MSEILSLFKALAKTAAMIAVATAGLVFVLGAIYLPTDTDDLALEMSLEALAADDFYEEVYAGAEDTEAVADAPGEEDSDHEYVLMGRESGAAMGATDAVKHFADTYQLQNSRVLEVGAGSGQLQDIVDDYTGLDIAASASRYFHKPFVHGSATDMPFEDSQFDAAWTVWTLEHVPNPELALTELRRVTRSGGLIFLAPAWNCSSWLADGYLVRPYSDFGLVGRLTKASLIVRAHPIYQYAHLVSSRILRRGLLALGGDGPTEFQYRRVEANYDHYWMPDSDAGVSLDPHEAMLWYESRGDECLNCPSTTNDRILMGLQPLVIRVNKEAPTALAESH